jgi:hypothetical protein
VSPWPSNILPNPIAFYGESPRKQLTSRFKGHLSPNYFHHGLLGKTPNAVGKLVDVETIVTDFKVEEEVHYNPVPQTAEQIFYYNLGYQAANVRRTVGYVPPDTDEVPDEALVN